MKVLEEINVLRYYKPFIDAAGGVGELKKALKWSEWYAVKWWDEIFNDLGLSSVRGNIFARALFISLRLRGHIDENGHVKKRPEKPELPTNSYAMEFVELHESFDQLGAVNMASNKADENMISVLYSTMLSQGWYKILRRTFLELIGIKNYGVILEPVIKEGNVALAVMELHTPKLYVGFDYRRDNVELAASVLKAKPGGCVGNICIYHATTACDVTNIVKRLAPNGVDAALLLHTLYWLLDPVKELSCIASALSPSGKLIIGQQVVESTPGLVAIVAAMGAKHVFSWKGVEKMLIASGYKLEKRYLRYMPYYIAIWKPRRGS